MKTISLQDISNALNISKATISFVLNGRGDEKRVSKETQERILKFANENKYKPNQLARGLSRGKSDMIGLIVPNISDAFFARIARRIEEKSEEYGYSVVFCSTGENGDRESKLIRSMLDRQVDGLIIASCEKNKEDILGLKKMNFPFTLVDRYYSDIHANFVGTQNDRAIAVAVEQLITNGKKRIGFISLTDQLNPLHDRLEGYKNTMANNNLPVEDGFIEKIENDNLEIRMNMAIQKMVQPPVNIEALVFATHFLTAHGMRTLKAMRLKVPEDIALISMGQMNDFDLVEPPITSLLLPSDKIGNKAVEILLGNIDEKQSIIEQVSFEAEFVVRKSCGSGVF